MSITYCYECERYVSVEVEAIHKHIDGEAEVIVDWDETPARWYAQVDDGRVDIAEALRRECDELEGRGGANAAAWVLASALVGVVIGGVVLFGLAVAWALGA